MAKRSRNILLILMIAVFAMLPFVSKADTDTFVNPNAHSCKKETSSKWVCTYKGEEYTWNVDENNRSEGVHFGSCEPLPVKLNENSGCLFCPLFLTVFNAVQDISTNSFAALAESFRMLLVVGYALWIALAVLPVVSSIKGQDAKKFIKSTLVQTFKIFLCYTLLTNPDYIYHWVIDTILIAGMDFGNSFLFNVDTNSITATYAPGAVNEGVMNEEVFVSLDKLLQALQQELGFLMAMASSTICVGLTGLNFSMFLNGIFVYVLTLILLITFGFYLADAIVQLGIIGAMVPLFIAAYPFKVTSDYTKKGFETLMNSFFTLMIIGVVISIDTTLILQSLVSGNVPLGTDPKAVIFDAFSTNDIKTINGFFDIGVSGGVGLIACIILAFKFTKQVQSLADRYSGGALLPGTSSGIATLGASAVTNTAKRFAKPIGKAIDNSAIGNTYRKATAGMRRGLSKFGGGVARVTGLRFAERMAVNAGARVYNAGRGAGRVANQVGNYVSSEVENSAVGRSYHRNVERVRRNLNLDTRTSRQRNLDDKIDKG